MQSKRNKILTGTLVALVLITIGVYFGIRQEQRLTSDLFIKDVAFDRIDGVAFSSSQQTIDIQYSGNKWRINDTYDADRNMIDLLFATLQQVVAKRSITGNLKDSLKTHLEEQGVRVSLLEQGRVIKTFYVGGNAQKSTAYFREEGSDAIWVGVIPGYRVYTAGIFELGLKDWRDRLVFNFNWENFKGLSVDFPSSDDGMDVTLTGNNLQVAQIQQVDTAKLYPFMDAVAFLAVDQFIDVDSASIQSDSWIFTIKIEDIAKRVYTLQLYPQPGTQNYLGLINGKDWAVLGKNKVLEIKHPRSYFKQE
jgi:hypothetical protein